MNNDTNTTPASLDETSAPIARAPGKQGLYDPAFEHEELAAIYRGRGLDADLADQVSTALMAHDALGAHARDELGLAEITRARPVQAALTSAATFAVGAALPLGAAALLPLGQLVIGVSLSALVFLMLLGALLLRLCAQPLEELGARDGCHRTCQLLLPLGQSQPAPQRFPASVSLGAVTLSEP